ncbi:Uncharacterised protein [uncultured archaeon]|nr:Uncharacterised protein [uncultured archaeon]
MFIIDFLEYTIAPVQFYTHSTCQCKILPDLSNAALFLYKNFNNCYVHQHYICKINPIYWGTSENMSCTKENIITIN